MTQTSFNVNNIRAEFPNLNIEVKGKPLVYFDNAATTFKPQSVIDTIENHYKKSTSNVHRGVHTLSEQATADYESARVIVQQFLNANESSEIIFTKGTTESINLVAGSFGDQFIREGDEIIISEMEHHSNIVPWQILCEKKKAVLKVIPINDHGELILDEYKKLITDKTKLISVVYISNSLGTINPVKDIIETAHKNDIPVLLDAAQAVSHCPIDVVALDCDFLAFSAHKLYGPTGVGVLYGKRKYLDQMPPYQGGGDMIASVKFEGTTYNVLPYKFEAGTPNVAGVIGLGAAIKFVQSIGLENASAHKKELLDYATQQLGAIPGLTIIGTAAIKTSIVSFVIDTIHPHDLGTLVDNEGVAIRTGHHCTQPVMDHFKVPATARASFAWYNTKEEVDVLISAIERARKLFS